MEFITNHWPKSIYQHQNQILIQVIYTNYIIFALVAPVYLIIPQAIIITCITFNILV